MKNSEQVKTAVHAYRCTGFPDTVVRMYGIFELPAHFSFAESIAERSRSDDVLIQQLRVFAMYIRTGEKIFENIFVNWNKTPSLVP